MRYSKHIQILALLSAAGLGAAGPLFVSGCQQDEPSKTTPASNKGEGKGLEIDIRTKGNDSKKSIDIDIKRKPSMDKQDETQSDKKNRK